MKCAVSLSVLVAFTAFSRLQGERIATSKDAKIDRIPNVVLIIGENEYHTWETLPEFCRRTLEPQGVKCSFVQASPKEGDNVFTNFSVIKDADLLIVSARRRTPPVEMMRLIREHLNAGKPLVGIRTASHAFGAKPEDVQHEGWANFDVDVLGCRYQGHYNNVGPNAPASLVQVVSGAALDPVLTGVPTNQFHVTSHLYKCRDLASTTTTLMAGHVEGRSETEPVAWINRANGHRVFYTSLGNPDDFKEAFFQRLLLNGILWCLDRPIPERMPAENGRAADRQDTKPATVNQPQTSSAKEVQTAPFTPAQSQAAFQVADDLQIDQLLTEPAVRQPVFMNFDERGRLWVVQYLQYPFPAGLKMLSHDSVWRAVYDKVPPPPPHQFRGADKISIFEDTQGRGVFDKETTFVDGLNIVTAVTKGRGGVWVLNPPYLLFYPDKNNDDIPDGDPQVVLSGFGLEDTHSVVNSLRWGPDGWLYGCQGSTVTANVIRPGLDKEPIARTMGQQIWRYHPETKRFEVFAEGGGNAFGCEMDSKGRIFSGHNGGDTRGFHYMQGAYLQKGFEKHGPLSNPYAFGYFPPMPHPAVERFTHNFIIYDGGALPAHYNGKLFGIEPLQGRVVESEIVPDGSTFKTWDIGYPVSTSDQWFRPVNIKLGPDGAIYIADWYDSQINHYLNHQGQIDKSNGRIYRLKAKGAKPIQPFDLGKFSTVELIGLLSNSNKWFRQEALQLIGDRKDKSVIPLLTQMVRTNSGQLALESLWALNLSGGFTSELALETLGHAGPFVRLWTVRLLCDQETVPRAVASKLASLAALEVDVEARAQLACSAKRLPAWAALPIIKNLLARTEDVSEKRIPLLLWWALESKCESDRDAVLEMFDDPSLWRLPVVKNHILERLMRRYALAGTRHDLLACARLFELAPGPEETTTLVTGFEVAFQGRTLTALPEELVQALARSGAESVVVGLRRGAAVAVDEALRIIGDPSEDTSKRMQYIETLGEIKQPKALPVLLRLIANKGTNTIQSAALAALQEFDDPEIGAEVAQHFGDFAPGAKAGALSLLASRPAWSLQLLQAVDANKINSGLIDQDTLEKLKTYHQEEISALVRKHWRQEKVPTTAEMRHEIESYASTIRNGSGDPYAGRALFTATCAVCHKLFGQGAQIGPDLTAYKRDDLETMLLNIVNPSAEIREGYETYVVSTKDGRTLSGFLADRNTQVVVLRGIDGANVVLPRDQIEDMRASRLSLMPEGLLKRMNDQQVRDLFAYLRSTQPLVGSPEKRPAAAIRN